MKMKYVHTCFLCAIAFLSLITSSCATTQSASQIPNNLSKQGRADFLEIAGAVENPCAEDELQSFANLRDLLEAGKTCHEAYILSSEIAFFLHKDVEPERILGMVVTEGHNMVAPASFNLENRPRLGAESAPIEIVIFSDFQCPYCARAATTMHRIYEEKPEAVSIVFKQMPLQMHQYAAAASLISVYANDKGKFWQVHDRFFENQKSINSDLLADVLKEIGGNPDVLFNPESGQKYGSIVIEDIEDATKAGVQGTPSIFINGVEISAASNYDRLLARIEAELNAPEPASPQTREKNREKALQNCPYTGLEEMYSLMEPAGRNALSKYATSFLCPCQGTAQTLHDCAVADSCPAAKPLIVKLITRINEGIPEPQILAELQSIIQTERTKNTNPLE